jgi:hypothetical protein
MLLLLRSPLLLEGISTGACDDVPAACLIKILIIIWSNILTMDLERLGKSAIYGCIRFPCADH